MALRDEDRHPACPAARRERSPARFLSLAAVGRAQGEVEWIALRVYAIGFFFIQAKYKTPFFAAIRTCYVFAF
jgi:hypothetical protein